MRVAVLGLGATGARAARQLRSTNEVTDLVLVDVDADRAERVASSLGAPARTVDASDRLPSVDVAVLCVPTHHHVELSRHLLVAGADVVSTCDDLDEVRELVDLGPEVRERDRRLVVGAGFSPGLTCLLVRHAADLFDEVDEIHVAKVGTGGPECARQHHRALASGALDWRDGGWSQGPGGSGRQLAWFPDPVGAHDCYRASVPDAVLLRAAFPEASRITSRVGATRRDRLSARLPMLRPPHPEGGVGGIRVEVWGRRGDARDVVVYGAIDRPAVAAGAVAAVAALAVRRGHFPEPGAWGLAEVGSVVGLLSDLAERGVRAAVFEGAR